jgi:hypothetical protein
MKINRKSILTGIFLAVFSVSALASDFCDGFKRGYIVGYKQASGSSLTPLVPLCPLKPLKGFGDPESDYEFGYTIGYRQGFQDGG